MSNNGRYLESLLPTLWMPPLWMEAENTWGNKYYVKEADDRKSESGSENWSGNVYILTEPAWEGRGLIIMPEVSCGSL